MSNKVERVKTKSGNKLLGLGLICLLLIATFVAGIHIGKSGYSGVGQTANLFSFLSSDTAPDEEVKLTEFWRVWNLMEEKYVTNSTSTLSEIDLIRGAISGMVESYGDPYTLYMPPQEASAFSEEISGNFSGVGMEIGIRNKLLTVIAPLPDSPAQKAGILAGDIVAKVDGKSTEGMGTDEAVKLIRGEKGSEVTLTIYREGETEFLDIVIIRDVITIPTLDTNVEDGVFIIRLYSFNALAENKMAEAMQEYAEGDYKKMILDLRGNPGGFLESAVSIAGYFLESGQVVVRENFGDSREEEIYRTAHKLNLSFNPDNFVILIDGGSASASEILAGALSEHGVATTIGEKTFGKGSVQELVSLPDGSSLKVTIARWLTPNGISFSEGGLEPNVTIDRTTAQILSGDDTQKKAALDWLDGNHEIGEELGFNFD